MFKITVGDDTCLLQNGLQLINNELQGFTLPLGTETVVVPLGEIRLSDGRVCTVRVSSSDDCAEITLHHGGSTVYALRGLVSPSRGVSGLSRRAARYLGLVWSGYADKSFAGQGLATWSYLILAGLLGQSDITLSSDRCSISERSWLLWLRLQASPISCPYVQYIPLKSNNPPTGGAPPWVGYRPPGFFVLDLRAGDPVQLST